MSFLPFPKGQKGLHPQGKACTLGSEPVYCRMSIKSCGEKMHSQPASVSPRTLFTGHGETPREEEGVPPRSHQPLQGRRQEHPADVPTCLPRVARCRGQDPTDFTGTQAVPHGPGGPGTERQPGSLRSPGSVQSDPEVCAPSVQEAMAGWVWDTSSLHCIPLTVCLGQRGPAGRSAWP